MYRPHYHFIFLVILLFSSCSAQPANENKPTSTPRPSATPVPAELLQGIAYSPYRDCQAPFTEIQPSLANIQEDLEIIRGMGSNAIRTYSSTGANEKIPSMARSLGLKVILGIQLGKDKTANQAEIDSAILLTSQGSIEAIVVGNEVLLRNDLSETELIEYIRQVKEKVTVPVTTAENANILLQHPAVINAVDFVMVHLHPFWDGISIQTAAWAVEKTYQDLKAQVGGKRIVIGETGWPTGGSSYKEAVPSISNQANFVREFFSLAQKSNIEFFYANAFDEMWRKDDSTAPYWGLLDSKRRLKHNVQDVRKNYMSDQELNIGITVTSITGTHNAVGSETDDSKAYIYQDFSKAAKVYNTITEGRGNQEDTVINTCYIEENAWPETNIQISYQPDEKEVVKYADMYWMADPNAGEKPCSNCNMSKFQQLVFRARAEKNNTQIKFFVGGMTKSRDALAKDLPYPSSIQTPQFAQEADPQDGFVNLSTEWREYHIDLRNVNRSNIIDGFGWVAEQARTPNGAIFYLDDIQFSVDPPPAPALQPLHIYTGALRPGLGLGVRSSGNVTGWFQDKKGILEINFATWQDWAVAYIAVEPITAGIGSRNSLNISQYRTLSLEMKGSKGREVVYISLKHKNQPDSRTEAKLRVTLTDQWATFEFPLERFAGWKNLFENVFAPIQFTFESDIDQDETIYIRNIQYLP